MSRCRRGNAEVVWIVALLVSWPTASLQPGGSVRTADPLAGVGELIVEGRTTEAKTVAGEAQRVFRLRRDRQGEALSVLVLGAAELRAADLVAARADFERSAGQLEAIGDRFGAWLAHWYLGLLERAQRRPGEALVHQRQALALLEELEASSAPFSALSLKYLGRVLQMPPDLLDALATRPETVKPILLRIAGAMSRKGAIDALLELGRLEEAESELSMLRELSLQLGGMFGQEAAIQFGTLRRLQWRLDEAREILRQALAEVRRYQPSGEKEILELLIELETTSGRLDEALALAERALVLARQRGDPAEQSAVLVLRALVLGRVPRLEEAEATLAEALRLATRSGSTYHQAKVREHLGRLALHQDRPESAAVHLEAAARIYHSLGRSEEEAHTWILSFLIYARFDSRSGAGAALEKVREIATESGSPLLREMSELLAAMERLFLGSGGLAEVEDRLLAVLALPQVTEVKGEEERQKLLELLADLSQTLAGTAPKPKDSTPNAGEERSDSAGLRGITVLTRGLVHYQRREFAAARELWLGALEEAPRRELEVSLLALLGFSYGREGKDEEAIRYLVCAVAGVEEAAKDIRLEELLAGYLGSGNQVLFADLIDLLVRNGRSAEAFDYAERARARAFLQGLGNLRPDVRQGADPELVQEAETLRSRILGLERRAVVAPAGEEERLAGDLRQARERFQSLLVRLKVTNPNRASHLRVEPLRSEAVREKLAPDVSLVSYFVSSSRAHAWVLDRESFRYVPLPLAPGDLRGALCWAERTGRPGGGRGMQRLDPDCGGGIASAEDLYRKLIAPLRGLIRHRRLILIPHGELHALPFAALRDPRTGRHLVEDFTLTYFPSASVLGILQARETPVEGKALVLGAPEELDRKMGALPAARQEAEVVGRLLGARPLLGAQAKEARLYDLSGQVDLLHVAAHGYYEPRSPLFSRIALAPGQGHDGNLEVHEVLSDLDLSSVNLVVLSACETARGERSRGDEVTGLTRAFLYAGSPGVISTLWNIDDAATAVLMETFYRGLLRGATVAEALREAQLRQLRGGRYGDPYFWAAFSLTGDPQGRWRRPAIPP